jgi:hypothetical protein
MANAVGIDLGTTNSVLAVWEGGEPRVVPDAEGTRTTPSVVAFTDSGERLVGQLARRQAILNPKGTIYSAKRFVGRKFDEVSDEAKAVGFDYFRPEFLNRVDDIVLFTPLVLPRLERIVEPQFNQPRERHAEQRVDVELTRAGRKLIAERGFDPVYGARPLRRYISHEIETQIGRALLRGELTEGRTILVDARDGELVVEFAGVSA